VNSPAGVLYPDWPQYAARIRAAVESLTDEQLALRAGPEHGAIWQLAAHLAGSRVFWLCGVFGEPGANDTPWPSPLTDPGWEDDEELPRSGPELAWALDSSWQVVRDCLERWPAPELDHAAARMRPDGSAQLHTRASVLNRLFSHDAFHAGEISQLLGRHGLPVVDLWISEPAAGI
jgi:uncharacterized damage-inducible protein DinB